MWQSKKTKTSYALLDLLTPREVPSLLLERWGPESDGAYVVPVELMRNAKVLVSGGVADNVRFEAEVAEKAPGIRMGLFDHTILNAPDHTPANATWHKLGLGSGQGFVSLERAAILSGAGPEESIAVKLDIEGAEWEVIDSTPPGFWKRVDVLVIEFHRLNDKQKWDYYSIVLDKLNAYLIPVHVHGNNHDVTVHFSHQGVHVPITLEVTYVNRSLIPRNATPRVWNHPAPTPLDHPNKTGVPDLQFDYWIPRKFVFLRRLKKNIGRMVSLR